MLRESPKKISVANRRFDYLFDFSGLISGVGDLKPAGIILQGA